MKTLADYKNRALVAKFDLSGQPASDVIPRYKSLAGIYDTQVYPEAEAALFYFNNLVASRIALSMPSEHAPLSASQEAFLDAYHVLAHRMALRLYYYMFLITIRESRHVYKSHSYSGWKKLSKEFPEEAKWHDNADLVDNGSTIALALINKPPPFSLGRLTHFIHQVFKKGDFGSSYGGEAWAKVAHPLNEFVHGQISIEMMMDVGWTLAHNNGPIFNKGMLYFGQQNSHLIPLLDAQRTGEIGGFVKMALGSAVPRFYSDELKASFIHALELFPDIGKEPEWKTMYKRGALNHYEVPPLYLKSKSSSFTFTGKPAKPKPVTFTMNPSVSGMGKVKVEKVVEDIDELTVTSAGTIGVASLGGTYTVMPELVLQQEKPNRKSNS